MRWTWLVICWIGLVSPILADEPVDYLRRIKPVFQARCYACHGVLKQEAGLRLDTAALVLKGSESGAVIKPGEVESSSLLRRVSSLDDAERMPPEG
ncbi:MAG: c-type cytochrome domain-containing protein, partial [Schlesneria sp.]